MTTPSIQQLQRAIQIQEKIAMLEADLKAVLGGSVVAAPSKSTAAAKPGKKKRKMSAAGRANIIAAQKARWAKINGRVKSPLDELMPSSKPKKAPKKKRNLTPEGRARLAAAMKARWAARKSGAPALNAPKKADKKAKK